MQLAGWLVSIFYSSSGEGSLQRINS